MNNKKIENIREVVMNMTISKDSPDNKQVALNLLSEVNLQYVSQRFVGKQASKDINKFLTAITIAYSSIDRNDAYYFAIKSLEKALAIELEYQPDSILLPIIFAIYKIANLQ